MLDKTVALRVLAATWMQDAAAVRRFEREMRAVGKLDHPGIARISNVGEAGGWHYLVTEYLEGVDLAAGVGRIGVVSIENACEIVRQAAQALQHVHEHGLIHGMIKPSKLMLTIAGEVKVLGWGLAYLKDEAWLRDPERVIGTVDYVAPEQIDSFPDADIRSDIYSLGCTLYYLLAGCAPFSGSGYSSAGEKLEGHRHRMPPDIRDQRLEVRAPLADILRRMMAKLPNDRFQSPAEVVDALQQFASGSSLQSMAGELCSHTPDRPVRPEPVPAERVPTSREEQAAPYLSEDVQFTVYRPRAVAPDKWYPLLAFMHLESLPEDAAPDEPEPILEVERRASAELGEQRGAYRQTTQDTRVAVPREGEISLVPNVPGITFNPPRRSFLWLESVHQESFRLMADRRLEGKTAKGSLVAYLGNVILAEATLSIRVDSSCGVSPDAPPDTPEATVHSYRRIFASYSHRDLAIVEEMERHVQSLGDRYLRDWTELRAGEKWSPRLKRMIEEASVFQLFWSRNSRTSSFCQQEWRHALSLCREGFVRPTYWEQPMPGPVPGELSDLHFHLLPPAVRTAIPAQSFGSTSCPACGVRGLKFPESLVGKKARCPKCGHLFVIPGKRTAHTAPNVPVACPSVPSTPKSARRASRARGSVSREETTRSIFYFFAFVVAVTCCVVFFGLLLWLFGDN